MIHVKVNLKQNLLDDDQKDGSQKFVILTVITKILPPPELNQSKKSTGFFY